VARLITKSPVGTRTSRRALKVNPKPYWTQITPGRSLGYRKNGTRDGVWIARLKDGPFRREGRLGLADDVADADGVQVLDFSQAQKAADRWFLTALTEATGQTARRGKYSIKMAVEDYMKALENRGAPDVRNARYDLDAHVLPALGEIAVSAIRRPRISAWRARIASSRRHTHRKDDSKRKDGHVEPLNEEELRRRRSTANRSMRRLAAVLNYAVEAGHTHADATNWKLPALEDADAARIEFLDDAGQRALVKGCAAEADFQKLVRGALYSGARYGELGRLRIGDFNERNSTVFIAQSKSGKSRHIHLDPEARVFFAETCATRTHNEEIFLRDGGATWEKDNQKKPMRRACAQAKIKKIGFHQLRHSAASRWIMLGVSLKVVAEQLGHENTRMVDKYYGHLAMSHVSQTFKALPGAGLDKAAKAKDTGVIVLPKKANRA
jgi:integrase